MRMHLGGWWRLWIAVSVLYAIAVYWGAYVSWPLPEKISHHPAFDYQFSPGARSVLDRPNKPGAGGWESAPIVVEVANGHRFSLAGDTSKESMELVVDEYQHILEGETRNQRVNTLWKAFFVWLLPVVALCLLALTVRWVRAGFKRGEHDS
jgi:hypothetical protein